MDAVTLVAAALAVACKESRAAALAQLLREREFAAKRAVDLESALQAVGVANAAGDSARVAELVRQALGAAPDDKLSEAGSDASDDSTEPRCRRCGDRDSLHLMDRSGPWLDAESEAERTYCSDCLYG